MTKQRGFTLIEVLIALVIVAIALGALLSAMGSHVNHSRQLKDKAISHWVAMQAVIMIQTKMIALPPKQETSQKTKMFNQTWYWRAKASATPIPNVEKIQISTSPKAIGVFQPELIAYRRLVS